MCFCIPYSIIPPPLQENKILRTINQSGFNIKAVSFEYESMKHRDDSMCNDIIIMSLLKDIDSIL